ncbi:MAG: hypothetical protein HC820_05295 [Hydrococcus sp. RM1_1_31]|nr:hypothetical protein [Hydrococcus sp. RM1_1_31]
MGKQANELIKKFGSNYTFEELISLKINFGLAKIKYKYPGSVKKNSFTELEELAKDDKAGVKADQKKAIKLLLQTKRLNEKSGQN